MKFFNIPENIGFQDEMRIGLKSSTRRAWSKKGERPICHNANKYEWFYIYSVVFPFKHEHYTIFMPKVDTYCVNMFWEMFLNDFKESLYLIIWDGAGFHRSKNLNNFSRLKFLQLPPYSPELNPVESIWPVYREFIANKSYKDLDELEKDLDKAFWYIENNKKEILKRTNYNWIKKVSTIY